MTTRARRPRTIEQRHRLAKRVLLAPIAPLAAKWAVSGAPDKRKVWVLRRIVVPQVGAAARDYVREIPAGFRYGGNTRDLLGLMIYLFGSWEPNLSAFLRSRLTTGDTFIDVGANSGWFTATGATLVGPNGHVVAIEASPVIADRLKANLARNEFTNTRVIVGAVSSEPCFVDVLPGPAEHTGLTRVARAPSSGSGRVEGDTLPAMITKEEIRAARVVKIDVEGGEYDVVRGLAASLPDFSAECEFVVEVGPDRAKSPTEVDELIATFAHAGYRAYCLPNFYDVRSYALEPVVTELPLLAGTPTSETDIVFSRSASDTLTLSIEFLPD